MFIQKSKKIIEPASAAIIMALGIFLLGTIEAFPLLDVYLGRFLAAILLILWLVIYSLLTVQFFQKSFLIPFLNHPVQSFAIGTWIAGVSVLCNVFLIYFPGILKITQLIALINSTLWFGFIIVCLYNFTKLLTSKTKYFVHGLLLLSTVGTQSIVVLLNNVFSVSSQFTEIMIYLGILFYLISMGLIIQSFYQQSLQSIIFNWSNTNCIIHGALSITGFAIVTTETFSPLIVQTLWLITFILLVIVEMIELLRAKQRINTFGFKQGLCVYHVSQWSRNFTFGMFYVFTFLVLEDPAYSLYPNLQSHLLVIWAWVVLLALIIEVAIFSHHYLKQQKHTD